MAAKSLLSLLIIAFLSLTGVAQSCFNIGFEDSSFVDWEGQFGSYEDTNGGTPPPPVYLLNPGFEPLGHNITTGFEYDPFSDSTILTVAPGSMHSVQLGNSMGGRRTEWLSYEVAADTDLILVYAVAVVLQDPNHTAEQQPGLFVRLLDSNGNELDTICGRVSYVPGTNLSGFIPNIANPSISYRPWDFAGVDLAPYAGQNVTLEFHTRDCSLGAHFGYAYVDAGCEPREIRVDYCLGQSDSITFTAPLGFSYLWSSGDSTQSFTVFADSADSVYTCTMTSTLTGCSFTLDARIEPTFYTNFDIIENSCGDARLVTTLEINRGNIQNYYWDFGDTTTVNDTSTSTIGTYTYPGPGQYVVSLIVDDGFGCDSDTLTDTANIYFPPFADFTADSVCRDDSTHFTNLSVVSPNIGSNFEWDFGDGSDIDTNFAPSYVFGSDSLKTVTLIVWSDSLQCGDTITKIIEVFPRPNIGFTHPEPDSCFPHEVNFINLSTADSTYPITGYQWSFGNGDSSVVTSPRYVYQDAGLFDVFLQAVDVNGCADSARGIDYMRVYPIPTAEFTANEREVHILESEIFFDNQSNNADTYQWQFGSAANRSVGTSTDVNPSYIFKNSGGYQITLTALSNFGCFDTAVLNIRVIDDRSLIPNIITPNGDGLNDALYIDLDPGSVTEFQCTIYNRWGQEVFSSKSPVFAWDGSVNGEQLNDGTYFYVIDYVGFEGEAFSMRGDVKLLR